MKGEREIVPLDYLYEFSSGLSKARSEFGRGFPFLSFKDVFQNVFVPDELTELVNSTAQEQATCSVQRGDVFLTRTSETMDELGMSCVALKTFERATFNGFTKRLRPKSERVVPEYAGYFFRSPKFRQEVTAMSTLSTRASLNNEMLSRLSIDLPSVPEQTAIGYTLKQFDDKIELNRRMNEALEAIARSIFKSWFVDFDPVRAKMEGRHPPGVSAEFAAMFPEFLEESEAGLLPTGWRTSSIGEEFDILMGQSPPGNTYNEHGDGVPLYQGKAEFGARFPTRRLYCTVPRRMAKPGDTLVSVRAPVGAMNMAGENCCIGRGLAAVRHKSGSRSYTYYVMHALADQFESFEAEGTVFGSINKEAFASLGWIAPPPEVITAFERIVGPMDSKVELLESESRKLGELRDTLLPQLISGEIRVKEAS